ncbi:MAG: MerR family transcriptional regulator [Deltaproteobacteria bacterium]|jgi:DNA-binding transcriptional MerR regulator|nr:MerR family transcriptional regulator [Deltaproteobacteria bacterium]
MFKIGRLAELADCQVVTVRFYEKEGLLEKPTRGDNGYRLYGPADLERLKFIRHCRDHGIALSDIKELLKLRQTPGENCQPVDTIVSVLIGRLEEQLKSIERLRENLVNLKGQCRSGTIADCSILQKLSDPDNCSCGEIRE